MARRADPDDVERIFEALSAVSPIDPPRTGPDEAKAEARGVRFTILVAVVYLAFSVLLAVGLTVHARYNMWMAFPHGEFNFFTAWGLYGGILWGGGLLLGTLLYAVFVGFGRRLDGVAVKASQAPELYKFIHEVSRIVGVRPPTEVRLFNDNNAHVSVDRGGLVRLLFGRPRIVLTLGLPLIHGCRVDNLADVIAHELGHSRHPRRLRRSSITWMVFGWLENAMGYNQERLQRYRSLSVIFLLSYPLFMGAVYGLSRLLRGIHQRWLKAATLVSRMSEYRADYYSAHLVGGRVMRDTFVLMADLNHVGESVPSVVLFQFYRDGVVPDDLGRFTAVALVRGTLGHAAERRGRGLLFPPEEYLTHPSDAKRIKRALAIAREGCFKSRQSSSVLLGGVEDAARTLALEFYQKTLRIPVTREALAGVEPIGDILGEIERIGVARRFFGGYLPLRHGGRPSLGTPGGRLIPLMDELDSARREVSEGLDAHRERLARFERLDVQRLTLELERIRLSSMLYDTSGGAEEKRISSEMQRTQRKMLALESEGLAFERALFRRAGAALSLLQVDTVRTVHAHLRLGPDELEPNFRCLTAMEQVVHDIGALRQDYLVFVRVCAVLPGNEPNGPLSRAFMERYQRIRETIASVTERLSRTPLPLALGRDVPSVGAWLGETVPEERAYEETISWSHRFIQKLLLLREHLYAWYGGLCVQVEAALDREPLGRVEEIPIPELLVTVPQLMQRPPFMGPGESEARAQETTASTGETRDDR